MKHFKKKTIALVLASVVTVVGSFAASNYKNSLMGLSFESTNSGNINMVVQTKTAYNGNVTPVRKDANTFVLMLPEVNSMATTPDLTTIGGISDVEIKTMPYSNTAKGYTRITIKTSAPSMLLSGRNQIYIPDLSKTEKTTDNTNAETAPNVQNTLSKEQRDLIIRQRREELLRIKEEARLREEARLKREERLQQEASSSRYEEENSIETNTDSELPDIEEEIINNDINETNENLADDSEEHSYYILWAILIVLGSAFFYVKAREKMTEIAGEKLDIDVEDEDKPKEKNKPKKRLTKIKNTIKTLDNAYSKTSGVLATSSYSQPEINNSPTVKSAKPAEELNVVDLDELFKEQKAKSIEDQEAENEALEEFLSGFSFDEEFYESEQKEVEVGYDEEFYQQLINNQKITFTKNDMNCINTLLGGEINDDTIRNIEQYAVTNPIKAPSKQKILEDLVTTYTISQNLSFTSEDIEALFKIINVEIDKDFVTDLRTNPTRSAEMQKDISEYGEKPKKPSEIVTLSVSDMLPDLSEALRKQGNKKVESQRKAETIYYTEGYDVKTLSLTEGLPDLAKELNKKGAFTSQPSAKYEIVDANYNVGNSELKISSELPNLQDVMAHPEKYADTEVEEIVVDEQALLNNIANVQFKPFDDGTRDFEIINEIEEIPSVNDIQEELSEFDNFEIASEEEELKPVLSKINNEQDDLQNIYNNDFIELDNRKIVSQNKPKEEFIPLTLDRKEPIRKERKNISEDILKRINDSRKKHKNITEDKPAEERISTPTQCLLDGESFVVVSSVVLDANKGCYLVKNEKGYAIVSYIDNTLSKLKEYSELKSEKIQARLSEKLADGTQRFLIRIGIKKFVVDIINDEIRYVMDLC